MGVQSVFKGQAYGLEKASSSENKITMTKAEAVQIIFKYFDKVDVAGAANGKKDGEFKVNDLNKIIENKNNPTVLIEAAKILLEEDKKLYKEINKPSIFGLNQGFAVLSKKQHWSKWNFATPKTITKRELYNYLDKNKDKVDNYSSKLKIEEKEKVWIGNANAVEERVGKNYLEEIRAGYTPLTPVIA